MAQGVKSFTRRAVALIILLPAVGFGIVYFVTPFKHKEDDQQWKQVRPTRRPQPRSITPSATEKVLDAFRKKPTYAQAGALDSADIQVKVQKKRNRPGLSFENTRVAKMDTGYVLTGSVRNRGPRTYSSLTLFFHNNGAKKQQRLLQKGDPPLTRNQEVSFAVQLNHSESKKVTIYVR